MKYNSFRNHVLRGGFIGLSLASLLLWQNCGKTSPPNDTSTPRPKLGPIFTQGASTLGTHGSTEYGGNYDLDGYISGETTPDTARANSYFPVEVWGMVTQKPSNIGIADIHLQVRSPNGAIFIQAPDSIGNPNYYNPRLRIGAQEGPSTVTYQLAARLNGAVILFGRPLTVPIEIQGSNNAPTCIIRDAAIPDPQRNSIFPVNTTQTVTVWTNCPAIQNYERSARVFNPLSIFDQGPDVTSCDDSGCSFSWNIDVGAIPGPSWITIRILIGNQTDGIYYSDETYNVTIQ